MSAYCSKDFVVTIGNQVSNPVCFVFDRKNGKFVRQISKRGQGPGEYTEAIEWFWDSNNY